MSNVPEIHPEPPRPDTALAFLLAPGIAAIVGALVLSSAMVLLHPSPMGGSTGLLLFYAVLFWSLAFAVGGYATAAFVAVPVYLMLPERARSCFGVVMPLAGAIAVAPWLLLAAPHLRGSPDLWLLGIPFGLGCVAGVAFLFIRRPRVPVDGGDASGASPPPPAALSCAA